MPVTSTRFGPNLAMARGATSTMPAMMNTVIGSRADPDGNADRPSTCCR